MPAGECRYYHALLGIKASTPLQLQRCKATAKGAWRRQLLRDLEAAAGQGASCRGERLSWDLSTIVGRAPGNQKGWRAEQFGKVDLVVTDSATAICLYDGHAELLGAITFKPPTTAAKELQHDSLLATILFKCPLRVGIVGLSPPLRHSVRHYLAPRSCSILPQRRGWRADDVQLLRPAILQRRLFDDALVLSGSLLGAAHAALLGHLQLEAKLLLRLRLLDLSCTTSLPDASLAQLFTVCPNLRVLRAASSSFRTACLASLGTQQQQQQQEQQQLASVCAGADVQQQHVGRPAPALQHLEELDVSCCQVALADLLLAVGHLHSLTSLRACSLSAASTAPVCGLAGRLAELSLLDADTLSSEEAATLLQACSSLRRLALSGRRLAAEGFHRQPHAEWPVPCLTHLEVGWGTGGLYLAAAIARCPGLASLTTHVGAEVSDWHLEQLAGATSCHTLQELSLAAANITDTGITAWCVGCTGCARVFGCICSDSN